MRAFSKVIVERTESHVVRMRYLEQYTMGKAGDIVRSCSCMDTKDGFERAMELLKTKYGTEYHIAQSFSKKTREWKII